MTIEINMNELAALANCFILTLLIMQPCLLGVCFSDIEMSSGSVLRKSKYFFPCCEAAEVKYSFLLRGCVTEFKMCSHLFRVGYTGDAICSFLFSVCVTNT